LLFHLSFLPFTNFIGFIGALFFSQLQAFICI